MARRPPAGAPKNTASVYVRLSREANAENLSKEGMVRDCDALAERLGLQVIAHHVDDGYSGAIRNRPEFLKWLQDAVDGRAAALITHHTDRLTREGVNVAAPILDVTEGKDPETGQLVRDPVRLLDTSGLDSFGDETAFRFNFVIKAEVARAELGRMRERAKAARRRATAAGRWAGGPTPFGFHAVPNPDGPGVVLAIEPDEATALTEAAARVLAGEPLIKVVRWMNSPAGHRPRRAREWTQTTLRQSLTSGPIGGKLGETGACPALVSPDEAAALRQVLAVKAPGPRGGRVHSRLLSGLLRCHACDAVLQVSGRASRGKRALCYRCPTQRLSGTCPRPVSIGCQVVEDHVAGLFLAAWGDSPEYVRRATVNGAAAVEAAEQAVAEALAALGAAGTAENFARLQEAQQAREAALQIPQEAVVHVVPSGRTVREAWEESDVHGRRDLLDRNYAAIIIRPGVRGAPGIQPDRVVILGNPAFPADGADPADFRPGSMVAAD